VLMLLQSERGARMTELQLGLDEPENIDELRTQIPAMLAGRKGLLEETKERFWGFTELWGIELTTLMATSMLFHEGTLSQKFWTNVGFIAVFGSYVALKWSVFDKLVELRYLPARRKLASQEFMEVWETLANEYDFPADWNTFSRFWNVFSPLEPNDKQSKFSWTGFIKHLFTLGPARKCGPFVWDWFSYQRKTLLNRDVWRARGSRAYARHLYGVGLEGTYRIAANMFDAFLVFFITGRLVPDGMNYITETMGQEPLFPDRVNP